MFRIHFGANLRKDLLSDEFKITSSLLKVLIGRPDSFFSRSVDSCPTQRFYNDASKLLKKDDK